MTRSVEQSTPERGAPQPRTGLHVSGPFNSTKFTNCCGLAVTASEWKCPGCSTLISGREPK